MKVLVGGCLALVLGAAAAHAAPISSNLVVNGDFSNGLANWTAGGSYGTTPGTGIKSFSNSTTPYGQVLPAYNGITSGAFFDDDSANETLSQTLTLGANAKYNISFAMFLTGDSNKNTFTLTDTVSGLSQTFGSNTLMSNAWNTQNGVFSTTNAGDYVLTFNFVSGPTAAKDLALTGVSVSTVPLPASAPMFGAALLALAGFGYGMNRRGASKRMKAAA